jgi:hypothetical protein
MTNEEISKSAEKIIEKAERIERLTQYPEWKDFAEVLDELFTKEMQALMGIKLDNDYYRRIGFNQAVKYIQELPSVVKDKSMRELLLHQGKASGFNMVRTIKNLMRKQKTIELQRLKQILTGVNLQEQKDFNEDVYRRS